MKALPLLPAVVALCCVSLPGGEQPAAVTAKSPVRLWVDQIGYRTSGRKLAVVAGDQALPASPAIELCDAKDGKVVWSLKDKPAALKPYNKGAKDNESGDFIAHLDLSDVKTPGRYYLTVESGGKLERSCQFNIADGVYRDAALASWKGFYYQRADCEKPEKYAGVWNHGENHVGPNQAKEARIYKWNGKWPRGASIDIPVGQGPAAVCRACSPEAENAAMEGIRNNIKDHLKPSDISGAIRDLRGIPVPRPGGGAPYQHLKEVSNALNGMWKDAERLEECTEPLAQQARQQALDKIKDVLQQISQGIENAR